LRRKTSLYLTEADKKVLAKLMQLTGLRQSQIVGTGLRALLREIEHSPPCQRSRKSRQRRADGWNKSSKN
jgi:hypothetical protein